MMIPNLELAMERSQVVHVVTAFVLPGCCEVLTSRRLALAYDCDFENLSFIKLGHIDVLPLFLPRARPLMASGFTLFLSLKCCNYRAPIQNVKELQFLQS